MSKLNPEEKIEQKKEIWVARTSEILGVNQEKTRDLLTIERNQSLRINLLKTSVQEVLPELEALGWSGDSFDWISEGFTINQGREAVRDSELVNTGKVYIQNAASWLAVLALDPKAGEKILDVCSAPGGKTTHISAVTKNQASITANDNSKPRLAKLRANCSRLGAEIDRFTLFDASYISKKIEHETFDKILLDVPCSGEGMMNLNSSKDFETWSVAHIKRLQSLQKKIITQAWQLLKPGGTLVYSTCTMAPEENESVVDYSLRRLEGSRLLPLEFDLDNRVPAVKEWNGKLFNQDIDKCLRLKPSKNIHAFFVAKFIKTDTYN